MIKTLNELDITIRQETIIKEYLINAILLELDKDSQYTGNATIEDLKDFIDNSEDPYTIERLILECINGKLKEKIKENFKEKIYKVKIHINKEFDVLVKAAKEEDAEDYIYYSDVNLDDYVINDYIAEVWSVKEATAEDECYLDIINDEF